MAAAATYVRKCVAVLPVLLGCLMFLQSLFFKPTHDWDLDAFLYIGSRLWSGDLLYFKDFETKLPFLQYLFAVAIAFGGIGAWRIMTFLVVAAFGFTAARVLAADLIRRAGKFPLDTTEFAVFLFGLFLTVLYSLPGSMSAHLEMTAAAGAFLSLALMTTHSGVAKPLTLLFMSGLALSFASLVRPNYVYVIPVSLIFLALDPSSRRGPSVWAMRSVAFLTGFATLTLLSFLPYVLVPGGVEVLIAGLKAIAFYSDGTLPGPLFQSQFNGLIPIAMWFFATLYAACLASILLMPFRAAAPGGGLWACAVFGITATIALDLSLVNTHYFPHNAMMFVPYLLVILPFIWKSVEALLSTPRRIAVLSAAAGTFTGLVYALLTAGELRDLATQRSQFDMNINRREVNLLLLEYLSQSKQNGLSFLIVDHPIYHALLGEARVGDGHPSILGSALRGKRIQPVAGLALLSGGGSEGACKAIISARKDIIILRKDSEVSRLVFDCLKAQEAGYWIESETTRGMILKRKMN